MYRVKSRLGSARLGMAVAFLLAFVPGCVSAQESPTNEAGVIEPQLNTDLSRLVSRLDLVKSAGLDHDSGQYLVKIFRIAVGEECEVEGDLCEGVDLLISVASPDLYGDHALYRIRGLKRWEFRGWRSYAEIDSPEHFTSFQVTMTSRDGRALEGCGGDVPSGSEILILVNPWKAVCRASEPIAGGSTGARNAPSKRQ